MRIRLKNQEGVRDVGLKAPGIITFMVTVILVVIVLVSKYSGASIYGVTGNEFEALLTSYLILMMGCLLRGM